MSEKFLTQAMTTIGGGNQYGMADVVVQSLIDWIFDNRQGQLCLAINEDGQQKRCVIELTEIKEGAATIRVTTST